MPEDTATKIRRIIRDQCEVSEELIKPESSFVDDLGADSLHLVEMTLAFEETFDIEVEVADVEQILTVRDAIEYIEKRIARSVVANPKSAPLGEVGTKLGPS